MKIRIENNLVSTQIFTFHQILDKTGIYKRRDGDGFVIIFPDYGEERARIMISDSSVETLDTVTKHHVWADEEFILLDDTEYH